MKKLSLYIFLILMWCNVGFAGVLDQNKYICKDESNMGRTEINILKKYDDSYILMSENLGFGMVLVNFASIADDHLINFSIDGSFETVTTGHLYPPENNKRKYVSSTFSLHPEETSIMKSNITRFNDAPNKIPTQNLTKDELNSEIEIFKNIKNVVDQFSGEPSWGSTVYYCDIGENADKSQSSSKIPPGYIDILRNGCIDRAKKNNNLNEVTLNYCECYSNWFKDNLDAEEFGEFLYLSIEDKKKFIKKNKINQKCYKP